MTAGSIAKNTMDEIHYKFNCYTHIGAPGISHFAALAHEAVARLTNRYTEHKNPGDVVIFIGDRWELLPAAMGFAYQNIPIIHIQGGEISSNIDNKVRWAVSALADLHFVSHEDAHKRLRDAGFKNIFNTGCPSIDYMRIEKIKRHVPAEKYVICIFHPHTNEQRESKIQIQVTAMAVSMFCSEHDYKCYWFTPNNDPGSVAIREFLEFLDPIDNMVGKEFLHLLAGARMIVGNSSAGIREAGYLGVPSVNIGNRQSGRVRAHNVVNATFDNIIPMMEEVIGFHPIPSNLFGDGHASERIIKQIRRTFEGQEAQDDRETAT